MWGGGELLNLNSLTLVGPYPETEERHPRRSKLRNQQNEQPGTLSFKEVTTEGKLAEITLGPCIARSQTKTWKFGERSENKTSERPTGGGFFTARSRMTCLK